MKFRTPYEERYIKKGETFLLPSRTKQEPKDECNINSIMARYAQTGIIDHVAAVQPIYEDVAGISVDYQEALRIVENAQVAFDALPSALRKELDNNPANLVSFIQNPDNKERCVEYGLFNKPVVETPKTIVAPVVDNVPAPAPLVNDQYDLKSAAHAARLGGLFLCPEGLGTVPT